MFVVGRWFVHGRLSSAICIVGIIVGRAVCFEVSQCCILSTPLIPPPPHFRLLSQLDETERAFDEFWVRHQTKLEQCLQLRHFEHNYREVSLSSTLDPDRVHVIPFKLEKWLWCFCRRWGLCWIRCLRNSQPSLRWESARPTPTTSSVNSPPMRRESV